MIKCVKLFAFVLFFPGTILFFSCSDEENSNFSEETAELIPDYSRGKIIYNTYCKECHLETGEGIPGAFPSLKEKPANTYAVVNGVEGTVMKAFKNMLTDEQMTDVVNFVNHGWGNQYHEINTDSIKEFK